MKNLYVVDTNVLIAASAVEDAEPKDQLLRHKIFCWLKKFRDTSSSRLVLDSRRKIEEEYKKKLTKEDYGIRVLSHKWDTDAVNYVSIEYDNNGHGCLPETLNPTIHDREDRKMVAACLAALQEHGSCLIAFAAETDWIGWETALQKHGVELEPIIEDWVRRKYAEKQARKNPSFG